MSWRNKSLGQEEVKRQVVAFDGDVKSQQEVADKCEQGLAKLNAALEETPFPANKLEELCTRWRNRRMYELDRRQVSVEDVEAIGDPSSQGVAA